MRKILVLTVLLGLVVSANAALTVVVTPPDQPMGWASYENSKLWIDPSDELLIGFADDTIGVPANVQVGEVFYLGIANGPGVIDMSGATGLSGVSVAAVNDGGVLAANLGLQDSILMVEVVDQPIGSMLTIGMLFHCDGPGDVTFYAYDQNYLVVDTQVIHQTPEPATMVLLALGGLMLRRKV